LLYMSATWNRSKWIVVFGHLWTDFWGKRSNQIVPKITNMIVGPALEHWSNGIVDKGRVELMGCEIQSPYGMCLRLRWFEIPNSICWVVKKVYLGKISCVPMYTAYWYQTKLRRKWFKNYSKFYPIIWCCPAHKREGSFCCAKNLFYF
jgi:hypothetical protein